jgi:hypothetical protein
VPALGPGSDSSSRGSVARVVVGGAAAWRGMSRNGGRLGAGGSAGPLMNATTHESVKASLMPRELQGIAFPHSPGAGRS